MDNYISSVNELEALFVNRHNLKSFHYFTNDEGIYDHFCKLVAESVESDEDLRNASNITEDELRLLNDKYNLNLTAAYMNGPECGCGRITNGYDFIVNAVYRHGSGFLRNQKSTYGAQYIMPMRRAMDYIVCTNCGDLLPLKAKTTYKDSSSIDSYGPCTTDSIAVSDSASQ
ncbi:MULTISPECIES: hypothetical protein [unclassified Pseudovibrio]|uniref:hypothetical protein n=1 Tax=unclassified Pseudovibrio TaxID=2627060 RepID=UPI0007AE7CD1|nr:MULTISPECIES: hypothetical protein [unclassified Pseudovibrio]KZK95235.1 hypothetical protein PsW74_04019 [Pseudovibrio sp. W74]KZK98930.1 hypothetical protein PsAD5_01553 [Pseudovibrio sp. Ad5]KZL06154.1 hypothetical protein PsAD14_04693 [Pseudovibrio sp. Ad14]